MHSWMWEFKAAILWAQHKQPMELVGFKPMGLVGIEPTELGDYDQWFSSRVCQWCDGKIPLFQW